jgi:hypothetical protein
VHLLCHLGCILGFIVSNKGIMVDLLKVEAIIHLPPPQNIRQLQSLQGKSISLSVYSLTMLTSPRDSCAC